jgi:hypothetical protein
VTSTLAGPAATASTEPAEPPLQSGRALTGLDLVAGGALLIVALVAWASLLLAHVGAHSAPAALGLGAAVFALLSAGCVAVARRAGVRLVADLPGLGIAVACAAVAAALTFPGFSYGVADKDPGGYVSHAIAISQIGDYSFVDPLLETAAADPTFPVQLTSPGARFAGVWVRDASTGLIVPQFYHLWPALLATSYDVGGRSAMLATVPLMGVLSVLALCAALRRAGTRLLGAAGGLVAAGAGGLLLATNMLQVWQTRFPTTEVFAQALYVGALLGVVVALQTGWRPAAGFAGLLVGVGWLNRSDGFLLMLMSVALGAVLLTLRRWDGRATWYAAGLAVVLPHGFLQAYDLARSYTEANPHLTVVQWAAITVGCLVLALVLRLLPLHRLADLLLARRTQVVVGGLVVLGVVGLLALGFLRPRLFGADSFTYNDQGSIRSYDEQIMRRLSWFISLPGFALMVVGLTVVAVRRWHASVWAVVLPTLPIFAVYGFTASNSTRMLWWTRRYVPTVLPGIVVLLALAIAFFVVWRFRGRLLTAVPAVVALGALLAFFLSQSLPLREHDEWKGSFALTQELSDLSEGQDGVYLWEYDQGCCAAVTQLFATPLWLQHGQLSGLLPSNASYALDGNARTTVIERTAQRFPGQPLFIVADKGELPGGIDPASVEPMLDRKTTLPMWEESNLERPDEAREIPVHVSVWRVR